MRWFAADQTIDNRHKGSDLSGHFGDALLHTALGLGELIHVCGEFGQVLLLQDLRGQQFANADAKSEFLLVNGGDGFVMALLLGSKCGLSFQQRFDPLRQTSVRCRERLRDFLNPLFRCLQSVSDNSYYVNYKTLKTAPVSTGWHSRPSIRCLPRLALLRGGLSKIPRRS